MSDPFSQRRLEKESSDLKRAALAKVENEIELRHLDIAQLLPGATHGYRRELEEDLDRLELRRDKIKQDLANSRRRSFAALDDLASLHASQSFRPSSDGMASETEFPEIDVVLSNGKKRPIQLDLTSSTTAERRPQRKESFHTRNEDARHASIFGQAWVDEKNQRLREDKDREAALKHSARSHNLAQAPRASHRTSRGWHGKDVRRCKHKDHETPAMRGSKFQDVNFLDVETIMLDGNGTGREDPEFASDDGALFIRSEPPQRSSAQGRRHNGPPSLSSPSLDHSPNTAHSYAGELIESFIDTSSRLGKVLPRILKMMDILHNRDEEQQDRIRALGSQTKTLTATIAAMSETQRLQRREYEELKQRMRLFESGNVDEMVRNGELEAQAGGAYGGPAF